MIENILKSKYQYIKLKELTGGYTNKSYLLDGMLPPVIAKVSNLDNKDVETEIRCLNLLNKTMITPKVHDFFEKHGHQFIIMDYLSGLNGQKIMDDDINRSYEIYQLLGKHLAQDIHTIKYNDRGQNLPFINLLNIDLQLLDFIPSTLKDEVRSVLNVNNDDEYVLVHGDFGPHNSIYFNGKIYIIDWEWAGWGSSLQDISWVIWFVHLHYPQYAKKLSHSFLESYSSYASLNISEDLIKAFAVSRIMNIMDRIRNADLDVQNEWIRRLNWTLNTNFLG